jgi:hypothetical protein
LLLHYTLYIIYREYLFVSNSAFLLSKGNAFNLFYRFKQNLDTKVLILTNVTKIKTGKNGKFVAKVALFTIIFAECTVLCTIYSILSRLTNSVLFTTKNILSPVYETKEQFERFCANFGTKLSTIGTINYTASYGSNAK